MEFTREEIEIINNVLSSQFYRNTGCACACNYYDICNNCDKCKEDLVCDYLNDTITSLEEGIGYIN
jgi:hypothetical protein